MTDTDQADIESDLNEDTDGVEDNDKTLSICVVIQWSSTDTDRTATLTELSLNNEMVIDAKVKTTGQIEVSFETDTQINYKIRITLEFPGRTHRDLKATALLDSGTEIQLGASNEEINFWKVEGDL